MEDTSLTVKLNDNFLANKPLIEKGATAQLMRSTPLLTALMNKSKTTKDTLEYEMLMKVGDASGDADSYDEMEEITYHSRNLLAKTSWLRKKYKNTALLSEDDILRNQDGLLNLQAEHISTMVDGLAVKLEEHLFANSAAKATDLVPLNTIIAATGYLGEGMYKIDRTTPTVDNAAWLDRLKSTVVTDTKYMSQDFINEILNTIGDINDGETPDLIVTTPAVKHYLEKTITDRIVLNDKFNETQFSTKIDIIDGRTMLLASRFCPGHDNVTADSANTLYAINTKYLWLDDGFGGFDIGKWIYMLDNENIEAYKALARWKGSLMCNKPISCGKWTDVRPTPAA